MDSYDVEAQIRNAVLPLESKIRDLERELDRLRNDLGSERVDRQDADESIIRTVNSRTEHLV